ncbi:hypothetical protein BJ875DRAFT_526818 [Amylocarpus encephaloides]|uniref:Uncharacterized protein n=1 Tax=Amylocarpus encephaloides TaxID=45428 RepID=A0A9P8C794_9HELO|nr:hypothetical protein BJ875DRAFT_526818 [Amylocarpus encephaloides]
MSSSMDNQNPRLYDEELGTEINEHLMFSISRFLVNDPAVLVIVIKGIATHHDFEISRSGCGVEFGQYTASKNIARRLPIHYAQTSPTAELYAFHLALRRVMEAFIDAGVHEKDKADTARWMARHGSRYWKELEIVDNGHHSGKSAQPYSNRHSFSGILGNENAPRVRPPRLHHEISKVDSEVQDCMWKALQFSRVVLVTECAELVDALAHNQWSAYHHPTANRETKLTKFEKQQLEHIFNEFTRELNKLESFDKAQDIEECKKKKQNLYRDLRLKMNDFGLNPATLLHKTVCPDDGLLGNAKLREQVKLDLKLFEQILKLPVNLWLVEKVFKSALELAIKGSKEELPPQKKGKEKSGSAGPTSAA